jgi:hypothetical protein
VGEIIAKDCCGSVITVDIRRESKETNEGSPMLPQERRGFENVK